MTQESSLYGCQYVTVKAVYSRNLFNATCYSAALHFDHCRLNVATADFTAVVCLVQSCICENTLELSIMQLAETALHMHAVSHRGAQCDMGRLHSVMNAC